MIKFFRILRVVAFISAWVFAIVVYCGIRVYEKDHHAFDGMKIPFVTSVRK